jgi:hypothetical protein
MKIRTAYPVMKFANAAYLRQTHGEAFYRGIAGPGFTEWAPEKGFEHRQ